MNVTLERVDPQEEAEMLASYRSLAANEANRAKVTRLDRLRNIEDLAAMVVAQVKYGMGVRNRANIMVTLDKLERELRRRD